MTDRTYGIIASGVAAAVGAVLAKLIGIGFESARYAPSPPRARRPRRAMGGPKR